VAWFARVRREWGNFEAALTWAVEREDADLAVRVASMTPYWWRRGLMSEGRRWLDLVLGLLREPASNPATTGAALRITISAGFLSGASGDVANGLRLIERGEAIAREVGDTGALAMAMAFRAWLGWLLDRPEWTDEVLAEAVDLEGHADPWSMGFCLTILGVWMTTQGRYEDGLPVLERAVPLLEGSDEIVGRSVAEAGIALAKCGLGDAVSAMAHAERSLRMLRESGDVQALPTVVEGALVVSWKCGPPPAHGLHAARARVMGGIERVRETAGVQRAPNWRADWDALLRQTRAGLGVEAFMDAYASSPEVSPLEVIDDALRLFTEFASLTDYPEASESTEPRTVPARAAGAASLASTATLLTSREREVALLIARGFTSRQIADHLVISERTADTHAGHIREKLGLHSRAEIAAWVAREGLDPLDGAFPPERGA
jgi:DNA-binding CsgD family transcriptional regulator